MNKNLIGTVYDRYNVHMYTEQNMESIYERYTVHVYTNGIRCRIRCRTRCRRPIRCRTRYRISILQKPYVHIGLVYGSYTFRTTFRIRSIFFTGIFQSIDKPRKKNLSYKAKKLMHALNNDNFISFIGRQKTSWIRDDSYEARFMLYRASLPSIRVNIHIGCIHIKYITALKKKIAISMSTYQKWARTEFALYVKIYRLHRLPLEFFQFYPCATYWQLMALPDEKYCTWAEVCLGQISD